MDLLRSGVRSERSVCERREPRTPAKGGPMPNYFKVESEMHWKKFCPLLRRYPLGELRRVAVKGAIESSLWYSVADGVSIGRKA